MQLQLLIISLFAQHAIISFLIFFLLAKISTIVSQYVFG